MPPLLGLEPRLFRSSAIHTGTSRSLQVYLLFLGGFGRLLELCDYVKQCVCPALVLAQLTALQVLSLQVKALEVLTELSP